MLINLEKLLYFYPCYHECLIVCLWMDFLQVSELTGKLSEFFLAPDFGGFYFFLS